MADLVAKSALSTVEKALKNTLLLAVGTRLTFATIAALRAFASAGLRDDELAYVTASGFVFQFSRFSTAADDGANTIAPTDAGTSGRWLVTTSTVTSGYAKQVRVHTGQDEYLAMLKRAQAGRPSIHFVYAGTTYKDVSQAKGALYWCAARYGVVAISSALRSQAEAAEGSSVPAETDPGTHNMLGDVIGTLAGSSLGQAGVAYVEIASEAYKVNELAGRLLSEEMAITVYYTVQQPDTGDVTLDALSGISVQRQLLGGTQPLDIKNYVTSGYTVPTGGGTLTAAVAAGTAVLAGVTTSSTPSSRTWAASSDTYRDLQVGGAFVYTAVANGANAPAVQGTSAMRVGCTVTNATGIVYDAMIAPTLVNFGSGVDWLAAAGVPTSIAISPSTATSASGTKVKFTCTATYADTSTKDVSTLVAWSSSAPSVATIDYTGNASVLTPGTSSITCTLGVLSSGTATLTGT